MNPTSPRLCFPSQPARQAEDKLNLMLKQTDKRALTAELNSGSFSQETLHSLLYTAWSTGPTGIVRMLCETGSYTADVVDQIVMKARENNQEEFVSDLLNESLAAKTRATPLCLIEAERGINPDNDRPPREKLINLAPHGLSVEETDAPMADAPDSLSTIAPENKIDIGKLLKTPDLLRYGQVSRDFNPSLTTINKYR